MIGTVVEVCLSQSEYNVPETGWEQRPGEGPAVPSFVVLSNSQWCMGVGSGVG